MKSSVRKPTPPYGVKGKDATSTEVDRKQEIDRLISARITSLSKLRENALIYPFLQGEGISIEKSTVDDVYDDLRSKCRGDCARIDVIVDSGGGNIDHAYNLALLFRRYAKKQLNFLVPRWAKSAATLLVCAGNKILMTPVAELGPIDPQITEMNPLDKRLESFSPLHIQSTLALIREEFIKGHEKLARGLLERLQFPLTLGSFTKSLEVGEDYLIRLLSTRMLTDKDKAKKAEEIAKALVSKYPDHSFCIEIDEAKALGLSAELLPEKQLELVWDIHKLNQEKVKIERRERQKKMKEMMKNLPPELLETLPGNLFDGEAENSRAIPKRQEREL